MTNNRSVHYLFRTGNMPDEEVEKIKEMYARKGIRVVVLTEGPENIHDGLKGMLFNHG